MTEKRFTIIYNEQSKMMQYVDNYKEEPNKWAIWNASETAQELNKLNDENEQLKQNIRELQNDKLLTELQMKCDKKQEHIVVLENKIRRMREAIHKLEWLSSHRNTDLIRENKQLKSTIKEVTELLSDEVDLFSNKATEHDINAYIELRELDNKDAYYMATATKKAIQVLKELQE